MDHKLLIHFLLFASSFLLLRTKAVAETDVLLGTSSDLTRTIDFEKKWRVSRGLHGAVGDGTSSVGGRVCLSVFLSDARRFLEKFIKEAERATESLAASSTFMGAAEPSRRFKTDPRHANNRPHNTP